jgi:hypothetical protein
MQRSPQNALLALKDQIMVIPPGRRKDSVKTGAADSAGCAPCSTKSTGIRGGCCSSLTTRTAELGDSLSEEFSQ